MNWRNIKGLKLVSKSKRGRVEDFCKVSVLGVVLGVC